MVSGRTPDGGLPRKAPAEEEHRIGEPVTPRLHLPWPQGRRGTLRRPQNSLPIELSGPLWYEERRYLGRFGIAAILMGALMWPVGLFMDVSDPDMSVSAWELAVISVGAALFGLFVLSGGRSFTPIRVGREGVVIGVWEIPADGVRTVWVLTRREAQKVCQARRADGMAVDNANNGGVKMLATVSAGVLVHWSNAPVGIRTRFPLPPRDVVVLIASKDPETLARTLTRFPHARRAVELPALER